MMKRRKPYFVLNHVPKCAGTSLRRSIFKDCSTNPDNHFYGNCIYVSTITHSNICIEKDGIGCLSNQTRVFVDHSRYGVIEKLFGLNDIDVYTCLTIRNPIDRILSHNNFFTDISTEKLLTDEESFRKLITICGNIIQHYMLYENIMEKINTYDFIFNATNQEQSIEKFNDMNPYRFKLDNVYTNVTNKDKKKNYPEELITKIQKAIPKEIDLYHQICDLWGYR